MEVSRNKLFKTSKFTNDKAHFAFVPERDEQDPMRGVYYRFFRAECRSTESPDDQAWWTEAQKSVIFAISKKRTTVTQAIKHEFLSKWKKYRCYSVLYWFWTYNTHPPPLSYYRTTTHRGPENTTSPIIATTPE
jgi:hypothetical protein